MSRGRLEAERNLADAFEVKRHLPQRLRCRRVRLVEWNAGDDHGRLDGRADLAARHGLAFGRSRAFIESALKWPGQALRVEDHRPNFRDQSVAHCNPAFHQSARGSCVHARPRREAGRYLGVGIGVRDMHAPGIIKEQGAP